MKNKIISAIVEIKKAGARKIPLDSAEYYAIFESLCENDRENFARRLRKCAMMLKPMRKFCFTLCVFPLILE